MARAIRFNDYYNSNIPLGRSRDKYVTFFPGRLIFLLKLFGRATTAFRQNRVIFQQRDMSRGSSRRRIKNDSRRGSADSALFPAFVIENLRVSFCRVRV